MAIATAYHPVELPNLEVWFGDIITANSTTILISDGIRQATYQGEFTYSGNGDVFGTLYSVEEQRDGQVLYLIEDINVDANAVYNAVQIQADFNLAATIVLEKNDTLTGSSESDEIRAYTGADYIEGKAGADKLLGMQGNDTLAGGAGRDKLTGGNGADSLLGGNGNDTLLGGTGADILKGGSANDNLQGGKGRDILGGGSGADKLLGGAGLDTLYGAAGRDNLWGGSGSDQLNGGNGNDHLYGGSQADMFVFSGDFGNDTVHDFNDQNNAEKIDLSGIAAITGMSDLRNNHLSQDGDDAVITAGNNSITLINVEIADLDAGDFIF